MEPANLNEKFWSKTGRLVFFFFIAVGLIDLITRIIISGPQLGIYYSIHDPGKIFFHIVILPLASIILATRTPVSLIWTYFKAWDKSVKWLISPFIILILVTGLIGSFVNDKKWRCGGIEAYIMPFDIYSSSNPESLKDMIVLDTLRAQVYREIFKDTMERKYDLDSLKRDYKGITAKHQSNCGFYPFTSFLNFWELIETILAVLVVAYLFTSIIVLAVHRRLGNQVNTSGLITTVAILAPWIILRAYSDLYINFTERINASVYVFIIVLFIFILIAFIMDKKMHQIERFNAIYSAIVGLGAFFTGVIGKWQAPFEFLFGLDSWLKILLFVLILTPLLLLVIDQFLEHAKNLNRVNRNSN